MLLQSNIEIGIKILTYKDDVNQLALFKIIFNLLTNKPYSLLIIQILALSSSNSFIYQHILQYELDDLLITLLTDVSQNLLAKIYATLCLSKLSILTNMKQDHIMIYKYIIQYIAQVTTTNNDKKTISLYDLQCLEKCYESLSFLTMDYQIKQYVIDHHHIKTLLFINIIKYNNHLLYFSFIQIINNLSISTKDYQDLNKNNDEEELMKQMTLKSLPNYKQHHQINDQIYALAGIRLD